MVARKKTHGAGAKLAACCSALFALAGCAAEVSDERSEIELELSELGYPTDDVEIEGDVIRVDGDMILSRDKLLAGEYAAVTATSAEIEKGYEHFSRSVSSAVRGNIKLAWGTSGGSQVPTTQIRNAFISAAGDYNSVVGSALRISQNNTGPTIRVRMIDKGFWPTGTPCSLTAVACADAPTTAGNPGANLYVKSGNTAAGCANWTNSALAFIARHELGHTVGFTHPGDPDIGEHIIGTEPCSPISTDCTDNPGYHTVMKRRLEMTPSCEAASWIPQVLQTDDRTSVSILF